MTKITHSAAYPKLFQRRSILLGCQVFNVKTAAALKNTKKQPENIIVFAQIITNWSKTMNFKDKYFCVNIEHDFRSPLTMEYDGVIVSKDKMKFVMPSQYVVEMVV